MKVLNCDLVDVPQAAIAELPPALLGPALQRLVADGHLLARNGGSKPILYRLRPVEVSGAMITEVDAEPPKAVKRKRHYVTQPKWRKVTKAQAQAISAALRKRRAELKLSQAAFAKQAGLSYTSLSNYERGLLGPYISKTLGDHLKRIGLGNLVPKGGAK